MGDAKIWIGLALILILALTVVTFGGAIKERASGMVTNVGNTIAGRSPNEGYALPDGNTTWCRIGAIPMRTDDHSPISAAVIGYDTLDSCCVRQYIGFSECRDALSTVEICIIGEINTIIQWVRVDGTYMRDWHNAMWYIDDLSKHNTSRICDRVMQTE